MLTINLSQDKSKINRYLSTTLLKKIDEYLKKNKKIILYLNKRWDFNSLICNKCNFLFKCPNCDVSLSIHSENMICHICNFSKKIENNCNKCNSTNLQKIWIWTSQIENIIKKIFSNFKVFRFDTDVIKNKTQKENALKNIEDSDIIIWTKMITTGFDFQNIWLIWVILLEQELQIPKYNTEEKVYSNIKQLIWRWWRLWEETEFIIQTFIPENEIIQLIINWNYKDFFKKSIQERKLFNYPPFKQLAIIEYKDKDKDKSFKKIKKIEELLKEKNIWNKFEINLIWKYFKKHSQYYYKIIIKWDNLRTFLENIKKEVFSNKNLSIIFE